MGGSILRNTYLPLHSDQYLLDVCVFKTRELLLPAA